MNINFSDQNCLTSITRNALRGETGPDGQNIFGHTDVLINDFFVNASTCAFSEINKDNSFFKKTTTLGYLLTWILYHLMKANQKSN